MIIFVRTDYLDRFRYFVHYNDKKNNNNKKYIFKWEKPFNNLKLNTCSPYIYNIDISDRKDLDHLKFFLYNLFDYTEFLDGQLPIIINSLKRNDTIGLLPTGGGKSLCYQ